MVVEASYKPPCWPLASPRRGLLCPCSYQQVPALLTNGWRSHLELSAALPQPFSTVSSANFSLKQLSANMQS